MKNGAEKHVDVTIVLSKGALEHVDALLETGLYGFDRADVVERLAMAHLAVLLKQDQQRIGKRPPIGFKPSRKKKPKRRPRSDSE